jgi:hypothetical protein
MPSRSPGAAAGSVALVIGVAAITAFANFVLAWGPVAKALEEDSRNSGYVLRAHFGAYLNPSTLVLDLREVKLAAPVDLLRGVFEAAGTMHAAGRRFDRVVLERRGTPVFLIKGEDFDEIGRQRTGGENPVYMIRKFPSKLYRPDGTAAYGEWSGGIFGVLSHEMEDVNHAVAEWAGNTTTSRVP